MYASFYTRRRVPEGCRRKEIRILFGPKVPSQVSHKIRSIDPEEAVALIEAISRVHDLEVDTEEPLEKTEEIRKKLEELVDLHRKMRKAEEKRGAPEAIYV